MRAAAGGLALLAMVVLASFVVVASTLAVNRGSRSSSFATGSVEMETSPTAALLRFSNMAPGDGTAASLTIHNEGTQAMHFAATVSADNADHKNLRDELVLTIKTKTTNPCSVFDGVLLYSGSLNPVGGALFDDRVLEPSAVEELCFKVELPIAAPNTVQAASTEVTFTFSAEATLERVLSA